uniref:Pectinesterase inhibitor domain-containing protein n=1 Tax=Leersia perrieri TaxID=77586 RepID=A0A0D9XIB6_9ORYZ
MALPTRAISLLSLFLLFIAATSTTTPIDAAGGQPPSPSPATSSTFVRSRCATTRYPDICYDYLLPYASKFKTSHIKLAITACDVAAARLRAFSGRIKDLLQHTGSGAPRVEAALKDCKSTISAAEDLARESSSELGQLDTAAGGGGVSSREARLHVSNVKTWLSAAITNEVTCSDGFEEAGEAAAASPEGKEVVAGVASVMQHTSIALALVNAVAVAEATAPCSTTESASSSAFLRSRCATTRYPDVCYDSLLPYASEFKTSHVKLAVAAADVAAAHLRAFSAKIKDLLLHTGGGREDAALHDCASTISAAANLARRSSAELTRLDAATAEAESSSSTSAGGGGSSRLARWQVSNAKTWLSAAMTNEGTCSDGFDDAGAAATASPAGKEVAAGVAIVTQHTSNALALVNGIPV